MLLEGALFMLLVAPACGPDVKIPAKLDKLSAAAKEVADVSLDSNMLKMAGGMFGNKGGGDDMKKLTEGLNSIYVRNFEFDKPGLYTEADYQEVRQQLQDPQWSRIVNVKEKRGETVEVYMRRSGDKSCGLAVIAAEPKELSIVVINGEINPEALMKMGGQFGIPKGVVPGIPSNGSQKKD